jgi:hypothetical protein
MYIENSRMIKREQLFTVVNEIGDKSIDNVCPGCPLERLGCSHYVDIFKGRITARVNLNAPRVKLLKENKEKVNCGNSDINFNV